MGTIPINLAKPDRRAYETALNVLREGGVIGIFPEGKFTPDGHVSDPKAGAARMAIETGAKIVPATLTGLFGVWAPQAPGRTGFWGRVIPRPGKITVKFHPPVALDPAEREARAHDKEYHRQITERVMAPVIRRVEPAIRAEARIEELVRQPASPIRIYEALPLLALAVSALIMWRWELAQPQLLVPAALFYACYLSYLLMDIFWVPQNRRAKFVRNVAAPLGLLLAMFPTLFDAVAQMRLSVSGAMMWETLHGGTPWYQPLRWPFGGLPSRWLTDWWTVTYLFPLAYIASSLWTYYFSHYLQFQKLVRGLLLVFYAGLLLVVLVPVLGRAWPVAAPPETWGAVARWFHQDSPASGWRFVNFPGFFVAVTVYLWCFDRQHRLPARAAWAAPLALNVLAAAMLFRGLPWVDAAVFALFGWLVVRYLGAVKFLAHDGRWV
jgi:hypothetical protein